MNILFKKLDSRAIIPTRAYSTDLGWDIYCIPDNSFTRKKFGNKYYLEMYPGRFHLFSTGFATAISEGYGFIFKDRSSTGIKKNLHVLAGVIDNQFRAEWKVGLINLGKEPQRIYEGDRIVQAILISNFNPNWKVVDELPNSLRGEAGFGSTGD